MRIITLILALLIVGPVCADSWRRPQAQEFVSPNGQMKVRILPRNVKAKTKPVAMIYRVGQDGETLQKSSEFPLINLPVSACILDSGDLYTFDTWGTLGWHPIIWYSTEGVVKAQFTLGEIFPQKELDEIKKTRRTSSSLWWRNGKPKVKDRQVRIDDSIGGYIVITEDSLSYHKEDRH